MDEGSYTWPGVAGLLRDRFVCVRVDTDRRPDVNERYNQGGWPTFAILDAAGEVLVGRTYVPGPELLTLLRSASDPTSRWTLAPEPAPVLGHASIDVDTLFARVMEAWDPYHAGFGEMQKFPHAGVLDWLTDRLLRGSPHGEWTRDALARTLTAMATRGMYDKVEGGFFRYATQDDWSEPHYEKLLEDHARLLPVYARNPGTQATIDTATRWLLRTLHDPGSGAFFGSQDADEAYYHRPAGQRGERPPVDRTIYAGWNGLMITALVRVGAARSRPGLIGLARTTAEHVRTLVGEDGCVTRHAGGVAGLLEDQVQVAEGFLAVGCAFGERDWVQAAADVLDWAWARLHVPEGGLWDRAPVGIGRLRHVRRNVLGNAAYSRVAGLLGDLIGGDWPTRSDETATAALAESEEWGFFAAPAGAAAERRSATRVVIKVATSGWPIPDLLREGLADPHPDHVWVGVRDGVPAGMAMACSGSACARPTADRAELARAIAALGRRQPVPVPADPRTP